MKRLLSLLVVMAMVVSMIVPTTYAKTDIDFDELVGTATAIDDVSEIAVNLEAGVDGHNYLWIPEEDGTLVLTVGEVAEGNEVEVMIVQGEASAKLSESADNTVSLDVVGGTRVVIRVTEVNKAALQLTLTGAFETTGLSAEDPIFLTETAAELKIPAGQTRYYAGRFSGMIMSFAGENVSVENNGSTYTPVEGVVSFEVAGGDFFNPPVIAITNNGTEDATYSVKFEYPIGSQMNPEAVHNPSSITVSVEAGNDQGYYLKWVSQGKGTLTLTCPTVEGAEYDVALTNNSSYVMNMLSESEDNTVSIETKPGDEIIIQVVAVPDESYNYAAIETTLTGAFEFAIGTIENPEAIINPESIEVSVEEGNAQGYYYGWFSRNDGTLVLTCPEIEGAQYDVILTNNSNSQQKLLSESEDNTVAIDVKNGDQVIIQVVAVPDANFNYPAVEAAITGEFVFPIGSSENPEAVFNPASIAVDIAAGNNQGYYYSWYSRNEGELVLTAPEVEGVEYDVILVNGAAMAMLSESEDNTVKMAVKAGEQVIIQVVAVPDESYNYPALQTTLTGEFVFPIGSRENPEPVINPENIEVSVEAGNNQGYFFKWISHAKGTLTLTCSAIEGVEYDVTLTNNSSYVMNMLSESEDNTVSIETNVGDEIIIQVVAVPDAEWNYPAVETAFTGAFEFAPGTLENPVLVFDPTEIVVNLEEGNSQGYYYTVYNRAAEGELSFSVSEITEGVACDVILTNGSVVKALSESEDGTVKIAINPGDNILVQVVAIPAEDTFEYPAAEVKLAGEIIYPVGSFENPEVIWDLNEINVSIAEGNDQGYYYSFYNRAAEAELVFTVSSETEGVEYDVILTNMTTNAMAWLSDSEDNTVKMDIKPGDQIIIQVVTAPDAEWNYPAAEIKLAGEVVFPVGSYENPEAIFNPETIEVDIAAGNSKGYYYSWYSRNEGKLVLTAPAVEGVEYDVILTNMNGYASAYLSDSEDGTVAIDVKAGDQVIIQVVAAPDAEWNYPALQTTLTGEFVFPVGSRENPEVVWELDEIIASIAEGNNQGYYYSFYNRAAEAELVFTVSSETEGVEYNVILTNMTTNAMAWLSDSEDNTVKMDIKPGDQIIIQVVTEPDAEWNYPAAEIKLAGEVVFPVGSYENPEAIFNPETIEVDIAEGNNKGYYYSWYSRNEGKLVLTAPAVEGVEYDVILTNMTTNAMAWLSDSEDGTVAIDVKAGDQVIIQVVVAPDAEWNIAALQTTLTGEFVFPVGSRENPEAVFNPESITVDIAAGNTQGYYYSWYSRNEGELVLTAPAVEGVEYDVILTNMTTNAMAWLSDSEDGTVAIDVKAGDQIIIQVVVAPDAEWNIAALQTTLTGEFVFPVGTRENPEVVWELDEIIASIAEGNNQGYYYSFYNRAAEAELVFTVSSETEGVEYNVILTNMTTNAMAWLSDSEDNTVKMDIKPGDQIIIQVVTEPDAEWNYPAAEIKLEGELIYPVGSQMNPEAVFNPETIEVDIAAGNNQGYYYKWVSQGKGALTLTCPAVEGVEYNVILTNMNGYAMAWLSDSEDGTVAIDVKPGDEVIIQVVTEPDAEWNYPALQTTLAGAFEYAVGTLENPEVVWDPTEIVVNLEEGNNQGYYYSMYNRAAEGELSISVSEITEGAACDVILMNGDAIEMLSESEDGTVKIAIKPGDNIIIQVVAIPAEGTFEYPAVEAKLAGEIIYPVGSQMNPEVIWDLSEIVTNLEAGNSQGYYYTYYNRAAEAELKFTVSSETEGVEYDVILTNMTDYTMAWLSDSEDGTVKLDIKPGDQINIQVVTEPDAEWNYPAAEIKLEGELIYPVGSQMNPEVITDPSEINVSIAAGNSQGYYYSYTHAGEEGTVTLKVLEATEGVEYDVILTNMADYSMAFLSDSEDGTVSIAVKDGEQIIVQVATAPDAEWNYPAADIKLEGSFETAEVLEGWIADGGKWYFYQDGVKATGWVQDANKWYFMDAEGVMQTGWLQQGNLWYYLNAGGDMVVGWAKIGGVYYYFNASGVMVTGWVQSGGVWYYMKPSGAMATGWVQVGSTWYYFASSGAMVTGWLQSGSTWYYFASSGAMVTGWLQVGSTWYYFASSGAMVTGWLQVGSTWYYFQSSGAMQTGWLLLGGTWYYFHSSGAMATGSVKIGAKVYNFNASGACLNP